MGGVNGIFILVSIPIAFLNEVNAIAALVLIRGGVFLLLFDKPQHDALRCCSLGCTADLTLRKYFGVCGSFLSGCSIPVALYSKSPRPPADAGLLRYVVDSFTSRLLPSLETIISQWVSPLMLAEVVFMLWLLIMGATPKTLADH